MHFSVAGFVPGYFAAFGDRVGDAAAFAGHVVPALRPEVVVVSGDLTDGKTPAGRGEQQPWEWEAYSAFLRNLTAAGVSESRIFDVRGNHDVFDVPVRGGVRDWYPSHSASGRRQREGFLEVELVGDAGERVEGDACPRLVLCGVDLAASPGFKSPADFAGHAFPGQLRAVEEALEEARAEAERRCGDDGEASPALLAFAHFPPSSIFYPGSEPPHGALTAALRNLASSGASLRGLPETLLKGGVWARALLSGHFHGAFGQRLHALHFSRKAAASPDAAPALADLETTAWKDERRFRVVVEHEGSLAFEDFAYLGSLSNAPRGGASVRAEEARVPGWRAARGGRGWGAGCADPRASAVDALLILHHPPEAGFAAALAPQAGPGPARALAVALPGSRAEDWRVVLRLGGESGRPLGEVDMEVVEQSGGHLFFEARDVRLDCSSSSPQAACPSRAALDVQVLSKLHPDTILAQAPPRAADLVCRPAPGPDPEAASLCLFAPLSDPSRLADLTPPLPRPFLETLVPPRNWTVVGHRLFATAWLAGLAALLACRALQRRWAPAIAASPLFDPGALSREGRPLRLLCWAAGWAVWPVAAPIVASASVGHWRALVAFYCALLAAPWCAGHVLGMDEPPALLLHFGVLAKVPALQGDSSIAPWAWRWVATPDTLLASFVSLLAGVLPLMLWCACVLGRRALGGDLARRQGGRDSTPEASRGGSPDGVRRAGGEASPLLGSRGKGSSGSGKPEAVAASAASPTSGASTATFTPSDRSSFSVVQILALLGIVSANYILLYSRMPMLMGWISVFLSPGFVWLVPVAVLFVWPRRGRGVGTHKTT